MRFVARHPVATVIEDALRRLGNNQAWLGVAVAREEGRAEGPFSQAGVSGWLDNIENQPPVRIFAIERALGMKPGRLSRMLGYLPLDARTARTVEDALSDDPAISDDVKDIIRAALAEARKRRS